MTLLRIDYNILYYNNVINFNIVVTHTLYLYAQASWECAKIDFYTPQR